MSDVLYDAHPSLIRTRPFGTLVAFALVVAGLWLALTGDERLTSLLGDELPGGAIGIALFAVGFLLLLVWYIATKIDHLVIKPDEILWTHGLLSKHYTEINMSSIRTVRVSQSLLQRILRAGDLTIYTAGDRPELVVRGLPDPARIRDLIRGQSAARG